MKKLYTFACLSALALSIQAQDAYDAARFATSDLNGTARYIGMGGALGALGGDITVMGSNPAGTGVYRRSEFNTSLSGQFTGVHALGQDASRVSWDNLGAVFAIEIDDSGEGLQFINVGLNYKKNRNFLGNLNTGIGGLYINGKPTFSQSFQIADHANDAASYDSWGMLADLSAENPGKHDGILYFDETTKLYDGAPAQSANYSRAEYGSISQVDMNVSFNISDRFFLGFSLGLYGISYNRESYYSEVGVDGYQYSLNNWYRTDGNGADLKFGFIARPFEDSPFRVGVSVATPTWYSMTDANGATMNYNGKGSYYLDSSDYEYDYRTPWIFDLSLGYTIGKNIAIGAEYEYKDFGSCKYSALDARDDNYFRNINTYIQEGLKGQHTLKLGVEYKPVSTVSLRLGYNYVTSPYYMDGFKDITFDGPQTETDWTNWKAINRFSAGVGFKLSPDCYLDFAYQRQIQKGDFYAFDDFVSEGGVNTYLPATEIKNNRSQFLGTFGFRF